MDPSENSPQKTEAEKPPSKLDQVLSAAKEKWDGLRIGEGHAAAMGRLGLTELRNAFNPSAESVASTEVGLYGTATQVEITRDRDQADPMAELDAKAAEMAKDHKQDGPTKPRGMER